MILKFCGELKNTRQAVCIQKCNKVVINYNTSTDKSTGVLLLNVDMFRYFNIASMVSKTFKDCCQVQSRH